MAIAESAAVASIIGKLLSMSTNLLERKESREIITEIREIQKLTIQLQSLYSSFQTENSKLQSEIISLQTEKSKLEHAILNEEREKDEILKRFNEWDQYERKVTRDRFVYLAHKTEAHVYACAVCQGKEPYPVILQPLTVEQNGTRLYQCSKCQTHGDI